MILIVDTEKKTIRALAETEPDDAMIEKITEECFNIAKNKYSLEVVSEISENEYVYGIDDLPDENTSHTFYPNDFYSADLEDV